MPLRPPKIVATQTGTITIGVRGDATNKATTTAAIKRGELGEPLPDLAQRLGLDPASELELVGPDGLMIFGKLTANKTYYVTGAAAKPSAAPVRGSGVKVSAPPSQASPKALSAQQQQNQEQPLPRRSQTRMPPDAALCIAYDARMLLHVSPADRIPETPYRLQRALEALRHCTRADQVLPPALLLSRNDSEEDERDREARASRFAAGEVALLPSRMVTLDEVAMCHDRELYKRFVEHGEELGKVIELKTDVYCCGKESSDAARLAAAAAIDMAVIVAASNAMIMRQPANAPSRLQRFDYGLCLIRPPGHHCCAAEPGGFCLLNNVALAVEAVRRQTRSAKAGSAQPMRVAVVDLDVHFGEGTVSLFENDPDVLYCSLHRYDGGSFYPFDKRGAMSYTGKHNNVCNVAVDTRASEPRYCHEIISDYLMMQAVRDVFLPRMDLHDPQLVIVSMGFDSAFGDPLGRMAVEGGFAAAISALKSWCGAHMAPFMASKGRKAHGMVVVLEGGYNPEKVANGVVAVTHALRFPASDVDVAAFSEPQVPKTWEQLRTRQQRRHREHLAVLKDRKQDAERGRVSPTPNDANAKTPAASSSPLVAPDMVDADDHKLLERHLRWCEDVIRKSKAAQHLP